MIKGNLTLSVKDIADLSTTKWDYNPDVAKNLCHQRADTFIGFILLLASYLLQLLNLLWKMRINDFAVNKKGVISAVIVAVIIFFIAYSMSGMLFKKFYNQAESVLKVDNK